MRKDEVGLDTLPGPHETSVLHPMLSAAFDALDHAGVRWLLMRRPRNPSAPTGDVDLLVDRADYGQTGRVLGSLGFGALPVWGQGRSPETFYLLYHPPSGLNLCLHVAAEISFGPGHRIVTTAAAGCLNRRGRRGDAYEPDPGDGFWMLLLHCLLDKGRVAPKHRAGLGNLAGSAGPEVELAGVAEDLSPAGWDATRMIEVAQAGDWSALDRLVSKMEKPGAKGRPIDPVLRSAGVLLAVLSSRSVRRYALEKGRSRVTSRARGRRDAAPTGPADRGITVALLGPDGVGKSTLAANLAGSLPGFGGVRMLYMGLGLGGLPRLARLPVPGSLAAVGLATLWWRYALALYYRARGYLVVFDRYTYDAWLPPGRSQSAPQRLARAVWAHACPAPDLVFLLDAPGRAVYERRGESDPGRLESARRDFLSLRGRIPQLQVIDASRPEAEVTDDVAGRITRYVRGDVGAGPMSS